MYYLKTENHFDAAHFLKGYEGKCSNIHGHRWRVVAAVKSESLCDEGQTRGMVVDFGDLKQDLKRVCREFDHCLIYEAGSLKKMTLAAFAEEGFKVVEVPFRPTAEHFSRFFFERLRDLGYLVHQVQVYETPNNCAVYGE